MSVRGAFPHRYQTSAFPQNEATISYKAMGGTMKCQMPYTCICVAIIAAKCGKIAISHAVHQMENC